MYIVLLLQDFFIFTPMTLPFFYIEEYTPDQQLITLTEDESKHIISVLRMKIGEALHLTDGKGSLLTAAITDDHKKKCIVKVLAVSRQPQPVQRIIIAISLLKNNKRLEWFLEKATEIGVAEIIPLICARTERQNFRYDRMKNILISAMLQSQQCWLPVLHEPVKFENLVMSRLKEEIKLIAHCDEGDKQSLTNLITSPTLHRLMAIGPEGDFTKEEVELALANNFIPVTLGQTRLRTETAGIAAAALMCIK